MSDIVSVRLWKEACRAWERDGRGEGMGMGKGTDRDRAMPYSYACLILTSTVCDVLRGPSDLSCSSLKLPLFSTTHN